MANNQVSVEITLEEKAALKALTQLTKQVQNTEDSFTKMGKKGDESLSVLGNTTKGVSDGFGSLVKGVTVANLASSAIIGTANAVKEFVLGSVNAAIEQQNAINRVSQALKASGEFSQSAVQDFDAFSDSLERNSLFAGDVVLSQIAMAKSMGATNEQAKELVQAAANMAATFGGSLEERVTQLGQSLGGTAGRLTKFIPELKNFTEEQLRSGKAIDLVNSKFSGAAAAAVDTYEGKVIQLSNSMGKLQEELGNLVIDSDAVQGSYGILSDLFQEIAQNIKAYNIELARGKEGFKESQESVNQLALEYESLTKKIEEAQAVIAVRTNPDSGFFESMFANAERAKEQLQQLIPLQAKLASQINSAQLLVPEEKSANNTSKEIPLSAKEDARIIKEQEVQAMIVSIREQARIAEEEQRALIDATNLGNKDIELEQLYAFEAEKLEAQFQAEEAKANLIKNSADKTLKLKEIQAKRELEFTKLGNTQIRAENQKKIEDQQSTNAALILTATNFLAAGQLLAKEGSAAQKAFQITQATMSTYAAANNALATPNVPYPVAVAFAASAVALGLANVAKIAGAKFEQGGIVGGNSMTGDNIGIRVNSGEMILNRQQQTSLFGQINNGGQGSGNSDQIERLISAINNQAINVSVDGRAIATAVRKEVQGGFKIA